MTIDKIKLQKLLWAEAASFRADCADWQRNTEALQEFLGAKTVEEVALELLAENERLAAGGQLLVRDRDELRAEHDQLKAENELTRMRIREMDLLFSRYILAMRSALIEEEHGKGPAAAMEWIYNSLAGPGELPPEGETDSQAYFDREIVAVDDGMQQVMAFHEARRAAMGKAVQS
ncbi:hypothetical protein [Pseudomonas mediterranea]|uniref:hypothetical protein n=1 Tax=Pseudomonas mediterranea TaxID=183795 RepID=UPI0006D8CDC0|nr:hypothetical protein [Pseudomonas mediterranea]